MFMFLNSRQHDVASRQVARLFESASVRDSTHGANPSARVVACRCSARPYDGLLDDTDLAAQRRSGGDALVAGHQDRPGQLG